MILTKKFWFSTNALCQYGYNFSTQPSTTMKFCQNVLYMYVLKVKKFQECTCLCLYVATQNIEGDENLHPPPRTRLRLIVRTCWLTPFLYHARVRKVYMGEGAICVYHHLMLARKSDFSRFMKSLYIIVWYIAHLCNSLHSLSKLSYTRKYRLHRYN